MIWMWLSCPSSRQDPPLTCTRRSNPFEWADPSPLTRCKLLKSYPLASRSHYSTTIAGIATAPSHPWWTLCPSRSTSWWTLKVRSKSTHEAIQAIRSAQSSKLSRCRIKNRTQRALGPSNARRACYSATVPRSWAPENKLSSLASAL